MNRIINGIKHFCKCLGTQVSPLAILHEVTCTKTTAIKPLAKLERSSIGKCTYIGTMAAVYDCEIGNFCSIAREAYVGGARHPIGWVTTSPCFHIKNNATGVCYAENPYEWKVRTCIGNDVWIGERAKILTGVTIGNGAVIGGGSVVTKDVGAYEIWAGNPARLIRKRFSDETIKRVENTRWWDLDDDELRKVGHLMIDIDEFLKEMEN